MERSDDILFDLLKDCKNISNFLDTVFGFLSRRTDFYVVAEKSNQQIGFEKGVAECLVRQSFYKWQKRFNNPNQVETSQDAAEIVEIATEPIEEEFVAEATEAFEETKLVSFDSSDYYNGACFDSYAWSQSIGDVDIKVLLPENVASKNLNVKVTANRIIVKQSLPKELVLLDGELCQKCKQNETLWSIDSKRKRLEIHLEKNTEMWWNCLLKTEESKLDLSKMDCSRPFHELSDEAQAKIEELNWNQEQKRLGKPTSDEINQEKILMQAWNAEGSPFTGDYDPSSVTFQ